MVGSWEKKAISLRWVIVGWIGLVAFAQAAPKVEVWYSEADQGVEGRFIRLTQAKVKPSEKNGQLEVHYRFNGQPDSQNNVATISAAEFVQASAMLDYDMVSVPRNYHTTVNGEPTAVVVRVTPGGTEVRLAVRVYDLHPDLTRLEQEKMQAERAFPLQALQNPVSYSLPSGSTSRRMGKLAAKVHEQAFFVGDLLDNVPPMSVVVLGYRVISSTERRVLIADRALMENPEVDAIPVYLVSKKALRRTMKDEEPPKPTEEQRQWLTDRSLTSWTHRVLSVTPNLSLNRRADEMVKRLKAVELEVAEVASCAWYLGRAGGGEPELAEES